MISLLMKSAKSLNFLCIPRSLNHRSNPWRVGKYGYEDIKLGPPMTSSRPLGPTNLCIVLANNTQSRNLIIVMKIRKK